MKRGDKQIPKRSKKTAKRYKEERVPFVKYMLGKFPVCAAQLPGCTHEAVDVHEILTRGRSGGVHGEAWLQEENCATLCRPCHTRITDDPKLGESIGLISRSGKESQALELTDPEDTE